MHYTEFTYVLRYVICVGLHMKLSLINSGLWQMRILYLHEYTTIHNVLVLSNTVLASL